jgi:hypothetical protein
MIGSLYAGKQHNSGRRLHLGCSSFGCHSHVPSCDQCHSPNSCEPGVGDRDSVGGFLEIGCLATALVYGLAPRRGHRSFAVPADFEGGKCGALQHGQPARDTIIGKHLMLARPCFHIRGVCDVGERVEKEVRASPGPLHPPQVPQHPQGNNRLGLLQSNPSSSKPLANLYGLVWDGINSDDHARRFHVRTCMA